MQEDERTERAKRRADVEGHARRQKTWEGQAMSLSLCYWVLSISAIVFSALAAAKQSFPYVPDHFYSILAALAAFAVTLVTTLNLADRADRRRTAWAYLGNYLLRYELGTCGIEDVMRACMACEAFIRNTKPMELPGDPQAGGAGAMGQSLR